MKCPLMKANPILKYDVPTKFSYWIFILLFWVFLSSTYFPFTKPLSIMRSREIKPFFMDQIFMSTLGNNSIGDY